MTQTNSFGMEMVVFSQKYPTVTKHRGTRCVRGVDKCLPFPNSKVFVQKRAQKLQFCVVEPVHHFEFGRLDMRFEVEAKCHVRF